MAGQNLQRPSEKHMTLLREAAELYYDRLSGNQFTFVFANRKDGIPGSMKLDFIPSNFAHLAGVEWASKYGNPSSAEILFGAVDGSLNRKDLVLRKGSEFFYKKQNVFNMLSRLEKSAMRHGFYSTRSEVKIRARECIGNRGFCLATRANPETGIRYPVSLLAADVHDTIVPASLSDVSVVLKTSDNMTHSTSINVVNEKLMAKTAAKMAECLTSIDPKHVYDGSIRAPFPSPTAFEEVPGSEMQHPHRMHTYRASTPVGNLYIAELPNAWEWWSDFHPEADRYCDTFRECHRKMARAYRGIYKGMEDPLSPGNIMPYNQIEELDDEFFVPLRAEQAAGYRPPAVPVRQPSQGARLR